MIQVTGTVVLTSYYGCDEYSEYMFKRTLNHMPKIALDTEDDVFDVHLVHSNVVTTESTHDDFNNSRPWNHDFFKFRERFIVVLDGRFYDRTFDEIKRFLVKWLVRLNKRFWLDAVCVRVWDNRDNKRFLTISTSEEREEYFGAWGKQEARDKDAWYKLITADQAHFTDAWNEYYCGVSTEDEQEVPE